MPSAAHETPLVLLRHAPELIAELLTETFGVEIPAFRSARQHSADIPIVAPQTFHADAVLVHVDADDEPVLAAVVEVQLSWDADKLRTWKVYLAHIEQEVNAPAVLVLYCSARLAKRYRHHLDNEMASLAMRPFFLTPDILPLVLDPVESARSPGRAILAALAHRNDVNIEAAFPALGAALAAVGGRRSVSYYDIVAAGLPRPVSRDWRTYMTSTVKHRFLSEHLRSLEREAVEKGMAKGMAQGMAKGQAQGMAQGMAKGQAQGIAQGMAKGQAQGKASALIDVLEARGFGVTRRVRQRVSAAGDVDLLDQWLRRAVTAPSLEDVFVSDSRADD